MSVGEFYRLKSKLFGELLKSDRSGKTLGWQWQAMAAGRENAWAKSLGSPLPGAPKRDTRRGANKREDKSTLQGTSQSRGKRPMRDYRWGHYC